MPELQVEAAAEALGLPVPSHRRGLVKARALLRHLILPTPFILQGVVESFELSHGVDDCPIGILEVSSSTGTYRVLLFSRILRKSSEKLHAGQVVVVEGFRQGQFITAHRVV